MNALPLKSPDTLGTTLNDTLDDLIADHGLRPVLLGLLARIAKRTRPPDHKYERLDLLDDHMRADLGLPPAEPHKAKVDLHLLMRGLY
ncbi:hypothetical protein C8N43_2949 [Litoreibacter ponti]|uniref:DUF1127 domain-containing protein n=1 Tax=Litoreibacter ponti TaxID=1510457 RepID=A0A2T6BDN2_9RHOB|nr:hypothetical protein [Litoreibacter ponti]PTX54142.1 hypothetical protein C8N43_2949 [Litoreibacter ponti]